MTAVNLKGLYKTWRKGHVYYYAWRGKGAPRILAPFGTDEFLAEFVEARSRKPKSDNTKFAFWVEEYKDSDEYTALAESTRRQWSPWLDRIKDHFGSTPIAAFEKPRIRKAIKKWRSKWSATPRTADYGKQVLSRVLGFAKNNGDLSMNACEGIPNLYSNDRADIIWTDDDVEHFCKTAPDVVRWAVELASITGLRKGDLLRFARPNLDKLASGVRTSKSRGRRTATVLHTPALAALCARIPRRNATTLLTNSDGKPWTVNGFDTAFRRAMLKAWPNGRELHFHDLRGTAATRLYAAGCTSQDIADSMGWSLKRVEAMIDRYVRRDAVLLERLRVRSEQAQNKIC